MLVTSYYCVNVQCSGKITFIRQYNLHTYLVEFKQTYNNWVF